MDWITIIIVTAVILFGLAVFYKALREPLDVVFGWIGSLFGWIFSGFSRGQEKLEDVVTYE